MKILKYLLLFMIIGAIQLNAKSLRIEAQELSTKLKDYTILDTRPLKDYNKGHIDGALSFPILSTYQNQSINGKITNPNKMQKNLRKLGLTINTPVVVYDDGTFFDSSRLFWVLEVYGLNNVKLLNAGYKTWHDNKYKISQVSHTIIPSKYVAKLNNKRLATKFTTQIASENPNQIIIDARENESYVGKKSSAKRFGHIPKAVNIPATHNINYGNATTTLKNIKNLKKIYKDLDKSKKVVIYCAIGRISSTNYFALRELDYNVANYDASWREWGNDASLPITNLSGN